jgi:flagellar hook-length control protein FliK
LKDKSKKDFMQISSSLLPLLNSSVEDAQPEEPTQDASFTAQLQMLQANTSEPDLNIEPKEDLKVDLQKELQENLTDNQGDLLEFFNFMLPTAVPLEINPEDALQNVGIVFSAEDSTISEPQTLVNRQAYQMVLTNSDDTITELFKATPPIDEMEPQINKTSIDSDAQQIAAIIPRRILNENNIIPVNVEAASDALQALEVAKTGPSTLQGVHPESMIQKNNRPTLSTFKLEDVDAAFEYPAPEVNQPKSKESPLSPLISTVGTEGLASEPRFFNPSVFAQSNLKQDVSNETTPELSAEADASLRTEILPQTIKNQALVFEKNMSFQAKANEISGFAKPEMELIPSDILLNNGQIHKASLKLDQGDMGVVSAQIEIIEQKSTVTMTVETHETKHLLQGHVSQLKEVFDNAELVLSQFNVDQETPRERKKQLTDERSNGQMRKVSEASVSEVSEKSGGTNSQLIIDTYA